MSNRLVLPTWRGTNGLSVARKLGLTSGLQLVLDAGDAASYTSGQSWLDLSGNGYDFFLGADGSATATDPTFNGTAGSLSSGEYFSFDGGDYFTYDSPNEAWMQFHKDSAQFAYMGWWYTTTTTLANIFGNRGADSGGNIGFRFAIQNDAASNVLLVTQRNGTTNQNVYTSGLSVPKNAWNFIALHINEAGGANGSFVRLNSSVETFDGAYTSPTASDASFTTQIGAGGNATNPFASGSRHAMSVAHSGVAISQGQVSAFFNATRGRFGI